MALTKNQLLQLVGNTIDAAQAAPDKKAFAVEQLADAKYKVLVELGPERDRRNARVN